MFRIGAQDGQTSRLGFRLRFLYRVKVQPPRPELEAGHPVNNG